jgi:hypothetical protein
MSTVFFFFNVVVIVIVLLTIATPLPVDANFCFYETLFPAYSVIVKVAVTVLSIVYIA